MSRFILMKSITFGWDRSPRSSGLVETSIMQSAQLRTKMKKSGGHMVFFFDGIFDLFVWKILRRACYEYIVSNALNHRICVERL